MQTVRLYAENDGPLIAEWTGKRIEIVSYDVPGNVSIVDRSIQIGFTHLGKGQKLVIQVEDD